MMILNNGVLLVQRVTQVLLLLYGIEIPEQSSGSELFFFFEQQSKQNSNENEAK
jgi:hypothetical protein